MKHGPSLSKAHFIHVNIMLYPLNPCPFRIIHKHPFFRFYYRLFFPTFAPVKVFSLPTGIEDEKGTGCKSRTLPDAVISINALATSATILMLFSVGNGKAGQSRSKSEDLPQQLIMP
jgi:hypothetical protein